MTDRSPMIFRIFCLSVCGLWLLFAQNALAQAIAPSPCDPKYMESLEARAWLEAQREVTQNQNLITKPDSVLEYTCFDKHLNALALAAPKLFSESNRWVSVYGNMAGALTSTVSGPVDRHISDNFNHYFLGERLKNMDYVTDKTVTPAAYACDIMNLVWKQAKCMGFIQNADTAKHDGFFTFEAYRDSLDKRPLPTQCPQEPLWGTNIDTAYAAPPWSPEPVITFFEALETCAGPGIPTGLVIRSANNNLIGERICPAPGCYFVPSGNGGSCQPST